MKEVQNILKRSDWFFFLGFHGYGGLIFFFIGNQQCICFFLRLLLLNVFLDFLFFIFLFFFLIRFVRFIMLSFDKIAIIGLWISLILLTLEKLLLV